MNSNEELIVAISLLIKNNPIVEFKLNENEFTIVHLDKSEKCFTLPQKYIQSVDLSNPFKKPEIPEIDYESIQEQVRDYIDSVIPDVPEPEIPEIDYESIYSKIENHINEFSERFVSVEDLNEFYKGCETKEIITEVYDDSDIRDYFTALINELRTDVDHSIHKIQNIDTDFNNVLKTVNSEIKHIQNIIPEKFIVDVDITLGDIYLVYNTGERLNLSLYMPDVNIVNGAGIGGSRGPRGKSAYQSWLDQGNTGTEADFINSLSNPNVFFQTTNTTPTQESKADPSSPYLVYAIDGDDVTPFIWEPE
ncbi:MAG: hypothetical protein R3230_00105 [Nitrosopumilaceae archaeon]|nr:hypothetical protein [Nitrosopumilaceae archaeon]